MAKVRDYDDAKRNRIEKAAKDASRQTDKAFHKLVARFADDEQFREAVTHEVRELVQTSIHRRVAGLDACPVGLINALCRGVATDVLVCITGVNSIREHAPAEPPLTLSGPVVHHEKESG